ncbi:condensation domain-containing protein, partial [Chryseobacterium sp. LAM-KRS1]|uniref:condensation domain-containing protein n=1 Tax=Chryseobacterium sp. LAM-KRS1 TaxID=2715754 RepID=UPI001556AB95
TSYRVKSSDLNVGCIKEAFGILVNRYTILRTSFDNHYGEVPLQLVHKKAHVDFKHLILESDLELANIKQGDIARGLDLSRPTQMRLMVIELKDGEYEFIWSHHHIIMDGWCLSILINDFSIILNSLKQGTEINLRETQNYSSYIKWLETLDKKEGILHWKKYLEGFDTLTGVPFKKQEHGEKPHFISEAIMIDGEGFTEIHQFCQSLGITLNTYVQAVWSYLLSKYNSSEEIVFGSVVSGRPAELEGIENMVGLFINTIPVRIKVDGKETPRSLLNKLHQDSIQSTGYHFNSLAEIQSLSSLGKDLINNIIVFENFAKYDDQTSAEEAGLMHKKAEAFDQNNYDFNIVVVPTADSLKIEFRYNSSVFYSSSIMTLVSHFKNVLNEFTISADQFFSDIEYLGAEEKNLLLNDFNATELVYPSNGTIISLFEDQVSLTPNNIAVVFDDLSLSYTELNEKASSLALQLQSAYGIKKGDQVGVMLNRGENQIVSILGILKLGAVYVPIDANLPESRKEVMTSGLSLLITESYYFFDLDFYSGESFSIDLEFTEEDASDFTSAVLEKDDIAYIIYTSGSTGEPKGVLNTHGGILNTILFQKEFFEVSSYENVAQFASFSFDASISEIFITLLSGRSLHILSDSVRKDAYAFEDYVNNHSIDLVTLPPAFFSLLNVERLQGLKGLITAGESAIMGKTKEYLKYGTFY